MRDFWFSPKNIIDRQMVTAEKIFMPDLSMFASIVEPKQYPVGHWFFHPGDAGDVMYIVLSGEVNIVINEKIVEVVRPGGMFGEMAVIDNRERSAGARAVAPTEAAAIDQRQFLELVRTHPLFSIEVMSVMTDRLRLLNQMLMF